MDTILTKQKNTKNQVVCQWIYKKKKKTHTLKKTPNNNNKQQKNPKPNLFWLKNKYFNWNISGMEKFSKLENPWIAVLAFQKKLQELLVI